MYEIYCGLCDIIEEVNEEFSNLVKSIEQYDSALKKTAIESWELENVACKHSKSIHPIESKQINLEKCSQCDLKTNLWLCLICGNVGCGRKYFDGTGGNNHGINHYE